MGESQNTQKYIRSSQNIQMKSILESQLGKKVEQVGENKYRVVKNGLGDEYNDYK